LGYFAASTKALLFAALLQAWKVARGQTTLECSMQSSLLFYVAAQRTTGNGSQLADLQRKDQ
jgi:hypothetical protein